MVQRTRKLSFAKTRGGRFGVKTDGPDGLNKRFRSEIVRTTRWRSEVGWTDELGKSVWLYEPTDRMKTGVAAREKFDLALLDECANARAFWNLLADWRRLSDAQVERLKKLGSKHLKEHWSHCLADDLLMLNKSLGGVRSIRMGNWTGKSFREIQKEALLPTLDRPAAGARVLGEIQFGNWALAYRDIGRILAVRQKFPQAPISLFVVAVATGCLADQISSGTVNFNRSRDALSRVGNDLPVPTWLVGIDYEHNLLATHPSG